MKRSIAHRLVLMFALAALATFALIGAALYEVLSRELERHQDAELAARMQDLHYSIERNNGDLVRWGRFRDKLDALTPADGSQRFWVLADDPRFQYGKGLDLIERMTQDARGRGTLSLPPHDQTFRTLSQHIDARGDRGPVRLIVGLDEAPFQRTLNTFLAALALLTSGAIVMVVLLSYWITRVGLQPLQQLSREAQALRPKTLSQRLSTEHLPVELSDLATAFNGALGRLEDAYQQLESFNADVAHELRTPLANMIGGTQVALSRARPADELREVMQSNLEELDRLRSVINDMLFLARADQGEAATGLIDADVAREVEKTIEFFEPLLDETETSVQVEGELAAHATMNVPLFRRALSNLIQNAIEHSQPGARLVVSIAREAGSVWIRVANPGRPIAPEQLPRLFTRFYRVDTARHDEGERHGYGLGLAIVKAVASMHGGHVSAASGEGMTTIAFSVPAAR